MANWQLMLQPTCIGLTKRWKTPSIWAQLCHWLRANFVYIISASTWYDLFLVGMRGKNNYYVVFAGRTQGIYESWPACSKQVNGFSGAIFDKHATWEEANSTLRAHNERRGGVNAEERNVQDYPPLLIPMEAVVHDEGNVGSNPTFLAKNEMVLIRCNCSNSNPVCDN